MECPLSEGMSRTHAVIRRAMNAVHRALGPGLAETTYRNALCVELQAQLQLQAQAPGGVQEPVAIAMEVVRTIEYRGVAVGFHRHDLVFGNVVIEIKVSKSQHPEAAPAAYESQINRYLTHLKDSECVVLVVIGVEEIATSLHRRPQFQ